MSTKGEVNPLYIIIGAVIFCIVLATGLGYMWGERANCSDSGGEFIDGLCVDLRIIEVEGYSCFGEQYVDGGSLNEQLEELQNA